MELKEFAVSKGEVKKTRKKVIFVVTPIISFEYLMILSEQRGDVNKWICSLYIYLYVSNILSVFAKE